jgi:hypothetical protein
MEEFLIYRYIMLEIGHSCQQRKFNNLLSPRRVLSVASNPLSDVIFSRSGAIMTQTIFFTYTQNTMHKIRFEIFAWSKHDYH